MATFNGTLNSNEIFSALYNFIISQQVFADNIADGYTALVDKARVDGTLFGDTKLYYASDVLKSAEWGNDAEASNLLALHRPEAPDVQKITLDKFRQICLTVDQYLSKRAWGDESAFAQFNSCMLGWIRDTKRVYDQTLYNTYVGTAETATGKQTQSVTLPITTGTTEAGREANNRMRAQTICNTIADIMTEMRDVSRDYNDFANLRSFKKEDLMVVWNASYVNAIKYTDLPTIFHKEGLEDIISDNILPSRYFGTVNASSGTTGSTNNNIRSLIEKDYGSVHVFPGDLLPVSTAYSADETYTENSKVICKIMHKNSVPYMSAFEVSTSFFNPKSLTETNFLTFGHNTLEYLKNYPLVTIKEA